MTSLHPATVGRSMLLRCGRVDAGRLARLRSLKGSGDGLKKAFEATFARAFKNGRETGALLGRPRRRSLHFTERDAEFKLYGRHVLAHRVPRACGQFEFRVVLLHLRNFETANIAPRER